MVEILVELMMYMHLLGRDWWWKFQAELMSERLDFLPDGPGLDSRFVFELKPTTVLEIAKRDDMPANNALLRALQRVQLSPESWSTVERYLDRLWYEDYALDSYIGDYVRSADLEYVVENFSQTVARGRDRVDEGRKRGLMQAVKVLKEIREREPELSGWKYKGWGCVLGV